MWKKNSLLPQPKLVKPFLKWAGGKSQLLSQLQNFFPEDLFRGEIENYCEPFLGGGAVYFWLSQHVSFKKVYLFDISEPLILIYQVVQQNVESLIQQLQSLKKSFLVLTQEERKAFFYRIREQYNKQRNTIKLEEESQAISRVAELIFLNKTCYNGLFRFNKKGEFNAPFGQYKNPSIFNETHLRLVAEKLKPAIISNGSFEECESYLNSKTFVYFDPPYRPLNKTSNFTSYSQHKFNDENQQQLAQFFNTLHQKDIKLMLSNSDPKNIDPQDDFFEKAYQDFSIHRVQATRMINSKSEQRGNITELLITNY